MSTFIIAEAGSSHDNDQAKAFRLIEAAAECGANAVKFQWTSNAQKMAERRGHPEWAVGYKKYLEKPISWLESLKAHADKIGIEWACTVYLPDDIPTIAPLVKRFKVSAFECEWKPFVMFHADYDKPIIISVNPHQRPAWINESCEYLHCISKYPTPIEEISLGTIRRYEHRGLSDHTTSTLTGALAVAAGATIVEKHIKLQDTESDNPDYPHSLIADVLVPGTFYEYVRNIREAEKAL